MPIAGDDTRRLVLEFEREVDRWQHTWSCAIDDRKVRLMTSVEGPSEKPFPSSPPIQEIHDHATNLADGSDAGAILGVGMAGKGHWSVSHSIEQGGKTDEACAQRSLVIRSDLACLDKTRDPQASRWLGSTYRIAVDWQMEELSEGQICFRLDNTTVRCAAGPTTRLSVGKDVEGVSTLLIEPNSISDQLTSSTRWMFDLG